MARAKSSVLRLSEMTTGQTGDFFALLMERTRGKTREGKVYYHCRFCDSHRRTSLMVWSDSKLFTACDEEWQVGQFYKIRGSYAEHERYGPQIEVDLIRSIREADAEDGFNPLDFVERSRQDPADMMKQLKELVNNHVADLPLRRLVLAILDDHGERWQRLPATRDRFYPFACGLLEHTLAVTQSCLELVERYRSYYTELKPPLNRDLVVAGAVLHDVGRIVEFDAELISPGLTIEGRLSGHLILGRDLVRDKARELGDLNPELLQLLEHILLSYLTLPEWGSPRLPVIPECLIIHHADDLDAKLEMYVRCLSRDTADGPFTDRDPVLNKQLFKGRMA
jgi:3'-5' exoribonuclease